MPQVTDADVPKPYAKRRVERARFWGLFQCDGVIDPLCDILFAISWGGELVMRIREIRGSDWTRVSEIYGEAIAAGTSTFTEIVPSWSAWNRAHRADCRLVAEEKEIVGWAALSPVSAGPAYAGVAEVSLYVANEAQRQGVGRVLMKELERQAKNAGIWTLQSSVFRINEPSLALHRACGYRTVGSRVRIARDRFGNWQDTVILEKRF